MIGRHTEDVLRVRINSVNELEKFPAIKYAKHFISEGHLRTDDSRYRKQKVDSLLDNDEQRKKFLPKLTFL